MSVREVLQLLLPFMRREARAAKPTPKSTPKPTPKPAAKSSAKSSKRRSPRQKQYDSVVEEMKATYGFKVRKWRRSMSGCAWELLYTDGRRLPMLESPYPKSPLSCSIFLHEVGHHAIGLGSVKPRCLEELRAWQWSLAAMEARGIEVDEKVRDRFRRSMEYAVAKAARRGIRSLPAELAPFLPAANRARQAG